MDAKRDVVWSLGKTVYPTVPLPVPGVPLVTVIQGAIEVAVQAQSEELAVTRKVPEPPDAASVPGGGSRV
jgi:hypothetical protein